MPNEPGDSGYAQEGRFGERAATNIISIVASLFGLFFGGVDRNTKRALEATRAAQVDTANELASFAVETGGWLARLVGFLRHAWSGVILALLKKLDHAILALADWLKRTLGPLLKFLRDVRKHIMDIYNKYFRPIFDTIEVFRKVLQLAGFLGIEAAKKLDQKLAELERRLRLPIDAIIRKVNEVIDVVDRVMTLDGFLQRYTLVRSLVLYQRDALKVWWSSIHRPMTAQQRAAYAAPLQTRSLATVGDEMRAYVVDHDGPDVGRIDEHTQDLMIRLRAL